MIEKGLWQYIYQIVFWSSDEKKTVKERGLVFGKSSQDVYEKLRKYYLDEDDDFSTVFIEELESGEITDDLVFPIPTEESIC